MIRSVRLSKTSKDRAVMAELRQTRLSIHDVLTKGFKQSATRSFIAEHTYRLTDGVGMGPGPP